METRRPETHPKTWGKELWISNGPLYCGKILFVNKDKFCSLHMHVRKTEDFFIMRGAIKFEYQKGQLTGDRIETQSQIQEILLKEGDVITVEPYTLHRFTGLCEDNQILEVSTQHFEDDSYRLVPSCS